MAAKKTESQKPETSQDDRAARLNCLRLAVEMRAGVSRPTDMIAFAEQFFRYVKEGPQPQEE